jgi:plasmid maintenance system antidote protein VapI
VESSLGPRRVTFDVLRDRLVDQVKQRINNGEFTERGLARILGISQSQAHNVLKGARSLQIQLADRILTKLGLSAMDLLSEGELGVALRLKATAWEDRTLEGFELAESAPPKKPAASSGVTVSQGEQKAG